MKLLLLILLTYAAFVLESARGMWSLPTSTVPQFLFLVAALGVLWSRGSMAIVWAVMTGLLADVVGGGPLGLNVVLLANLAFMAQMAGARESSDSMFTSAAFVLLFVTFAGFASQTLQHVLAGATPGIQEIGLSAASRAGGTAAVYLVVMTCWAVLTRSARLVVPSRPVTSGRPSWAR